MLEGEKAKLAETFERYAAEKAQKDEQRRAELQHFREVGVHALQYQLLMNESYELEYRSLDAPEEEKNALLERVLQLREEAGVASRARQTAEWNGIRPAQKSEEVKVKFLCRCPVGDCNGMVTSHGRCVACEAMICTKCFVEKKRKHKEIAGANREVQEQEQEQEERREHICDPDTLATVEAIKKESKPCPNESCGALISKVSGCDQMWCTQCRTAFSWSRNVIVHGPIHNPHALQWEQQMGIRHDVLRVNNTCAGFPHFPLCREHKDAIKKAFQRFAEKNNLSVFEVDEESLLGLIYNIDAMIEQNVSNVERELDELRLSYGLNKITEKKWKDSIFRIMRSGERKAIKHRVLTSLRETAIERMVILSQLTTSYHYSRRQNKATNENKRAEDAVFELLQLISLADETLKRELSFLGVKNAALWEFRVKDGRGSFVVTTKLPRLRRGRIPIPQRPALLPVVFAQPPMVPLPGLPLFPPDNA